MDKQYRVYEKLFSAMFSEEEEFDQSQMGEKVRENTSIADYVWLLVWFDGDMVYIDWKEEWQIEDYE